MKLVLKPGDIYMKPHPILGVTGSAFHVKRYGSQLLATCKQAYEEGRALYYSKNTFHLPAGRDYWSRRLFHSIQPEHQSLIQSVAITCSVYDLHYARPVQDIGRAADDTLARYDFVRMRRQQTTYSSMYTHALALTYSQSAGSVLLNLWRGKFLYVLSTFPGLKKLSVTFMDKNVPWLHEYFGLGTKPGNVQDQEKETKLAGRQAVAQDHGDYPGSSLHPLDTMYLSADDLEVALGQMQILHYCDIPLNRQLPLIKAAEKMRKTAENSIRWEFSRIDSEGCNSYGYPDSMFLRKSSWAMDRMNGKWPYTSINQKTRVLSMYES